MKIDKSFNSYRTLKVSIIMFASFSMMFVSCKDNSTSASTNDPKNRVENHFETCGDKMTDTDGNSYETVQIGSQCWMAEDLRTTSNSDYTSIPNVTSNSEWAAQTTGAWAYYDNDSTNSEINGLLYNWFAVNDGNGICPTGWKIPSDAEWKKLEIELGMTSDEANSIGWRGGDMKVGEKMRAKDGFAATLNGYRDPSGSFNSFGINGNLWSSSERDSSTVWTRIHAVTADFPGVYRNRDFKSFGLTARCILKEE